MAKNTKALMSRLSRRGPHRVSIGPTDVVGMPGVVYAPESGRDLPAVAFGHGWMRSARSYRATLTHLASWGIVAICPSTERGPVPSYLRYSTDLRTALQIAHRVRLGPGRITVHPTRLGVVGHGTGAGAALIAAAEAVGEGTEIAAVAALYPQPVSPAAEGFAARIEAPALVLDDDNEPVFADSHADRLVRALAGPTTYRRLTGADGAAFAEVGLAARSAGLVSGKPRRTQKPTRAMLIGYLLATLAGESAYSAFVDQDAAFRGFVPADPDGERERPGMLSLFSR